MTLKTFFTHSHNTLIFRIISIFEAEKQNFKSILKLMEKSKKNDDKSVPGIDSAIKMDNRVDLKILSESGDALINQIGVWVSFCGRPFIPVKADRRPLAARETLCCEEGGQRYRNCDGGEEEGNCDGGEEEGDVDPDTVCNETDSK